MLVGFRGNLVNRVADDVGGERIDGSGGKI